MGFPSRSPVNQPIDISVSPRKLAGYNATSQGSQQAKMIKVYKKTLLIDRFSVVRASEAFFPLTIRGPISVSDTKTAVKIPIRSIVCPKAWLKLKYPCTSIASQSDIITPVMEAKITAKIHCLVDRVMRENRLPLSRSL